ncbi:hypothetical protein [Reyranella sp.]|nr:hypothetical protein [Reyranella sp.]HQS18603.1 hypothetical protein [Reyranella sp.]HQT14821.1 hypothetical protein [Reyranella sp.]
MRLALADRLHRLPSEIDAMPVEDYNAFLVYLTQEATEREKRRKAGKAR